MLPDDSCRLLQGDASLQRATQRIQGFRHLQADAGEGKSGPIGMDRKGDARLLGPMRLWKANGGYGGIATAVLRCVSHEYARLHNASRNS